MVQVADGEILSDGELEILAAQREHDRPVETRRPYDRAVHQPPNVFDHRITRSRGLSQVGIAALAQSDGIRAAHTGVAQLVQGDRQSDRISLAIVAQFHRRCRLGLADALNAGSRIAVKYGMIFGNGDLARRRDDRIGIGASRAAIDGVEFAATHLERHAQFHQRQDTPQPRCNVVVGRRFDRLAPAGADRRGRPALRPDKIDEPARSESRLQRALGLLLDLLPTGPGNRRELTEQMVHRRIPL